MKRPKPSIGRAASYQKGNQMKDERLNDPAIIAVLQKTLDDAYQYAQVAWNKWETADWETQADPVTARESARRRLLIDDGEPRDHAPSDTMLAALQQQVRVEIAMTEDEQCRIYFVAGPHKMLFWQGKPTELLA